MKKILEFICEPEKIYVGSTFKIKIKAIQYMTYEDLKRKSWNDLKKYTYKSLKGE